MAKRLFLAVVLATSLVACKSRGSTDGDTEASNGTAGQSSAAIGRDAVERGLMSIGIEGAIRRIDLNSGRDTRMRIAKTHMVGDLLLLETTGDRPSVYALERDSISVAWVSELREPSLHPATSNGDTIVIVSEHYAHALSAETGRSTILFMTGDLKGIRRPFIGLPYTPNASAAVGNDTFYLASYGSASNNKRLEAFSMISGQRGWGDRASADITSAPVVGGDSGDPKLYYMTKTGHITCRDATNYGYPAPTRWEHLLDAHAASGLFVTGDSKASVGSLFAVDAEGVVYCLNRVTGNRRWTDATTRKPAGDPLVYGGLCVVPMASGLTGYDADNVTYVVHVTAGPDAGKKFTLRGGDSTLGTGANADMRVTDSKVGDAALVFNVSGEILTVSVAGGGGDEDEEDGDGGGGMNVDGVSSNRAAAYNGSTVKIGGTTLTIEDRGSEALWHDLGYDRVVARIGSKLVVEKDGKLGTVNAWTGAATGDLVSMPGVRLVPTNTDGTNLFAVGGDAVVYALFAR